MNTKTIYRVCVLAAAMYASSVSLAQDRECSEPLVTFGEVNAGLHAGFTGGAANEITLPSGFFLNTSSVDQRGFIDPESGRGWKCHSDWGLVSGWSGFRIGDLGLVSRQEIRRMNEAIIASLVIEVDGVQFEVVESSSKWLVQPERIGETTQILKAWGAFIEPYSLNPGFHIAKVTFGIDLDCLPDFGSACDGEPDFYLPLESQFEVLAD